MTSLVQRSFVFPPTPASYGAIGDGAADDTAAVNRFLAASIASGGVAHWGDGKTYLVTDNVPLLHSVVHEGVAVIQRGGARYHIGSCEWGAENRIYVGQTAGLDTNDGLTADRPIKIRTGFNILKTQAHLLTIAAWVLQLLNDTYPSQAAMRLDQWPDTEYPITIRGYADEAGNQLAVFRGWDGNVFRRLSGKEGGNLICENLKFTDSTGEQIVIQNGFNFVGRNLHADNIQNTAFRVRGGQADFRMITVKNGVNGVDLQGVYGSAGAGPDQNVVDGIVAENMTGAAVVISRGAISYVRRLTATNVGIGIDASRMCRVRMQNNVFNSWSIAAIRIDESVVLNNDIDNPNTYPGAVFGKPVVLTDNGATPLMGGAQSPLRKPHIVTHAVPSILTGTARTDMAASSFSPFRMPGWWLMSPYAYGWVEYDFTFPVAERLKFEVTGDHPSTSHILSEVAFDVTGQGRGTVRLEFSGSVGGSSLGLYKGCAVTSASAPAYSFGSTKDLAASAFLTSKVDTLNKFRIYVTRSVGTGDLRLIRMASDVAV